MRFLWQALLVVCVLSLTTAALALLLGHERVLRVVLWLSTDAYELKSADGDAFHRLRADGLRIVVGNVTVSAGRVELAANLPNWPENLGDARRLLAHLQLRSLRADNLHVVVAASATDKTSKAQLPSLGADRVEVARGTIEVRGTRLLVDSVSAAVVLSGYEVLLNDLRGSLQTAPGATPIELAGDGRVDIRPTGPLHGTLTFTRGSVTGSATLSGTLAEPTASIDVAAPLQTHVDARLARLEDATLRLFLSFAPLQLGALRVTGLNGYLDPGATPYPVWAEASLDVGSGPPLTLQARGHATSAQTDVEVTVTAEGVHAQAATRIEHAPLHVSADVRAEAVDVTAWQPALSVPFDVDAAVEVAFADAGTQVTANGSVRVAGREGTFSAATSHADGALHVERATLSVATNSLAVAGNPTTALSIEASIDDVAAIAPQLSQLQLLAPLSLSGTLAARNDGFGFDSKLQLRGNALTAAGSLDNGQLEVAVHAQDFDLAGWLPAAHSALTINADVSIDTARSVLAGTTNVTVTGTWQGQPVELAVAAHGDRNLLHVDHFEMRSPQNRATASGSLTDLDATLAFGNLRAFWPQLSGRLNGRIRWQPPAVDLDLDGGAIDLPGLLAVERITARGTLSSSSRSDLVLDVRNARVSDIAIATLSVTAEGPADAVAITVASQTAIGTFDATARAAMGTQRVDAVVERLEVRQTPLGSWQLTAAAPITFAVDAGSFGVSDACASSNDGAQLCADGNTATSGGLSLKLVALPLRLADPWLPRSTRLQGTLDASSVLTTAGWRLSAELEDAVLLQPGTSIAATPVENARIELVWGDSVTSLRANLDSSTSGTLALNVAASAGTLTGSARARFDNLAPLAALLPAGFDLAGRGNVDLELDGSSDQPQWRGGGTLDGSLGLPQYGISLTPLRVSVRGEAGNLFVDANATSGSGSLQAAGTLTPLPVPGLQVQVTGSNALAIARNDFRATVTPDLQVRWGSDSDHAGGLDLRGDLLLDTANVTFSETSVRATGLSADVIIHDAAGTQARAMPLSAQVNVRLGDVVRVRAAGLDARLEGRLRFDMKPSQPSRLTGFVNTAEGSYRAYGVELAIDRGRLDFDGPPTTPSVDVRAIRKLERDTVGLRVTGPLTNMQADLFAEPARNQAETLSLLITGESLATATASDLGQISDAGIALGIASALPITDRVRDTLALDELAIENPLDSNAAAIMIGKRLTDRLSARYTYSIFNRTGGLMLRYQITDAFSVQTEAAATTRAIDLLWQRTFD